MKREKGGKLGAGVETNESQLVNERVVPFDLPATRRETLNF